jgi:hypothetical protein
METGRERGIAASLADPVDGGNLDPDAAILSADMAADSASGQDRSDGHPNYRPGRRERFVAIAITGAVADRPREKCMSALRFAFGDQVRHRERPEWGVGSVVRVEDVRLNGEASQRLSVRFTNAGVKTLNSSAAGLERVEATDDGEDEAGDGEHPVGVWDRVREAGWLAPVAERKIEEAMVQLPPESRDMFLPLRDRLAAALSLFRFDRTGRGLIDWAVAQTGLDDPLTRFNRHELEQYFDRWTAERDGHLGRLLQEAATEPNLVDELLSDAPEPARAAVRRLR